MLQQQQLVSLLFLLSGKLFSVHCVYHCLFGSSASTLFQLQFLQQQSELNPQLALGALAGKGADGRDTGRSEADSRGAQSRPVSASVSGAGPRRGADPRMANAQANAWRDALAASGGAGGRLHDPRGADPTAMASLQALAASGNLSADMLQALQHSYLDPSTVASLQGMGLHSGHVDMGRGGRGGFM